MSQPLRGDRPQLRLVGSPEAKAGPGSLPPPSLDDSELLAAVRAGEVDAARALCVRVGPVIRRTVNRLLGSGDANAEDITQQALIELIATFGRFRGECSLDNWVSRVTAHLVFKEIRSRRVERKYFERRPLEELRAIAPGTPGRDASNTQLLGRIRQHLEAMDLVKAWTYWLHDVCGYDLKEVAQITDASVAAAQTRLVRGRRELHERIAGDADLAGGLRSWEGDA